MRSSSEANAEIREWDWHVRI